MMLTSNRGFTLIELLIVVAIIAILAAIAIPNFLEAQTRSKVSRVKAELRTFATALEFYCVDYNQYPLNVSSAGWAPHLSDLVLVVLTTPVAYLTSIADKLDPFKPILILPEYQNPRGSYLYFNLGNFPQPAYSWLRDAHGDQFAQSYGRRACVLVSCGPSKQQSHAEHLSHFPYCPENKGVLYDPTNGTNSYGGIIRITGEAVYDPRS